MYSVILYGPVPIALPKAISSKLIYVSISVVDASTMEDALKHNSCLKGVYG